jgi:protein-L-isoaspartate(D-aspartate) O-methyltransferase
MDNEFTRLRNLMVDSQLLARGIGDERVLTAMRSVPRHRFVPEGMRRHAYDDEPLPIGQGQTISQPYIVAYMTDVLRTKPQYRILEVGTGSGYQTAVLAELVSEVCTIEILPALTTRAKAVLQDLGYTNIRFRSGDGAEGWEEYAPYDGIMVTAAPCTIPEALKQQLGIGARLVLPVGVAFQDLILVTRGSKKFSRDKLIPVRFVPLIRNP